MPEHITSSRPAVEAHGARMPTSRFPLGSSGPHPCSHSLPVWRVVCSNWSCSPGRPLARLPHGQSRPHPLPGCQERQASCLCASSFLVYAPSPGYRAHVRDQNQSSWLTSHMAIPCLASPPGSCEHPVLRRRTQDSAFKSHLLKEFFLDLTESFLGSEAPTHLRGPVESTKACWSLS